MSFLGQDIHILQKINGHTNDVTTCDFAANFTLITGSGDKTVRVWDWIKGDGYTERSNSPLKDHKYNVTCIQSSPQGFMFASASVDGNAILWNVHSLNKIYTMTQVNGDPIRVCRFSPDSTIFVTAGDNGAVCIWDLARRSLIRTIFDHEGATQSLSFTPDSLYLVTGCSMELLNVWYVQDLIDTINQGPCSPAASIDNALDMGISSLDISRSIKIVNNNDNNELEKNYTLATSGSSNEIKIWNITSLISSKEKGNSYQKVTINIQMILNGHSSSVTCVKYNSNGKLLISSSLDKLIKIWDEQGNCLSQLHGHKRYVNCVTITKDTTLIASGSNDRQIIVWDLIGNLTKDSELNKNLRTINSDQSASAEIHVVQNVQRMELLEKIEEISDGAINCCCFYGNSLLAIGSGDKTVKLYNLEEKNLVELPFSPIEGHTYAVNYLDISNDGTKLATSSQDGCTFIWNPQNGGLIGSLPTSSLSVKVCKFSSNSKMLITAGDDEKALIWDVETMENITSLDGHLDTITNACFTPDSNLVVTTCFNEDFRLWNCCDNFKIIHVEENVHTTGIQSCDFSPNLEPLPNTTLNDIQTYLLATCGNDSVGKLWYITIPLVDGKPIYNEIKIKLWRSLYGHGGSLTCIKFSSILGEIVCSTATDRQARLWSVYNGECLHVLDHDSIVTTCAFTENCTTLAVGCIDKSFWLWKLPSQLVFQNAIVNKIKNLTKNLIDWTINDVINWLETIGLNYLKTNVINVSLNGQKIVTYTVEQICSALDLDEENTLKLSKEIKWLKQDTFKLINTERDDIPYEYLCPITHEIMMEPVICSDGFTYERRAITEWFMAGKYTSPMTNEPLTTTIYKLNNDIRNAIHNYLDVEE